MAIRKDLDDMLNSLKLNTKEPLAPERTEAHKKSIYDDMSVDDLLNALTEEKRPSLAENILNELEYAENVSEAAVQKAIQEASPEPEKPKKKKIVISGELPDYEELRRQEMEKTMQERRKAEHHLSEMNRLAAEAHEAIRQRSEKYSHTPAVPAKTELSEELIVNSSSPLRTGDTIEFSVPETARPAEPKKPQLSRPEPVVIEEIFSVEESSQVYEEEAVPEELSAPLYEEETAPAEEPAPVYEEEPVPDEEPVPEPEKPKKGLFSKLRSKIAGSEDEIPEPEELSAEGTPAEEESVQIDDLFNGDEPEEIAPVEEAPAADDTYESAPVETAAAEEPSAEDLIDAAIAAINLASETESYHDEDIAETPEEITSEELPEVDTSEDAAEDSDRVSSLIDGIREDAANAIADLDSPKEEEPEEAAEEPEKEAPEADKPAEEAPEKQPNKVVAALGNILSEDPDELVAERVEHTETDETAETEVREKKSLKKRVYTVLGVVFALFAVIGIITVAGKGIKTLRRFTSGEVKKDGFTEVIYPAVIMDIDTFDSPSELTSEQLITAAIWSIIMDEDKVSKYTPNAGGDTISISAYDVEAEAVELFGEDHQPFEHTTVGRVEPKFFYDTETGAYNVKLKPIIFTYEPEIKSIVKSGDSYTVSVDYLDELPSWMEKTVAKSVEFHLTGRDDGTYRIDSMHINYINNSH